MQDLGTKESGVSEKDEKCAERMKIERENMEEDLNYEMEM